MRKAGKETAAVKDEDSGQNTNPLTPARLYEHSLYTFVNKAGVLVDVNGVAVSFKTLKKADKTRWEEALDGVTMEPADFLKAVAFDPRFPIGQRIAAAEKAAPYFSSKKLSAGSGEDFKSPAQKAAEIMDALRAMDESVGAVKAKKQ